MSTPNGNPDGALAGIQYEERSGSGELSFGGGTATGTRLFAVGWTDRIIFAKNLTGYVEYVTTSTGTNILRVTPQTFPGYSALYCQSVKISGFGPQSNSSGTPSYPYAHIDATYSPLKQEESTNQTREEKTLSSLEVDMAGEFLQFGKFKLFWDSGQANPIADDVKAGKFVPTIQARYTEEESATDKRSIIRSYVGKINSSAWEGAAAETVLFLGAQVSRIVTTDGRQPWKIAYTFAERPIASWNKFFNPETADWAVVYDSAGAVYEPYEKTTFGGLLA